MGIMDRRGAINHNQTYLDVFSDTYHIFLVDFWSLLQEKGGGIWEKPEAFDGFLGYVDVNVIN